MNIITQHPSILYTDEIADICRPLQKLKINYFAHANINHAQELSSITSHPDFFQHYLEKQYYNADIHMAQFGLIKDYFVWDVVERSGLSAQMNEDAVAYGAKHPFTIIQKNKDGFDYYHFATGLMDQSINQIYISNIDLLKLFILHFKESVNQSKKLASAYDLKFKLDHNSPGFTTQSYNKEMDQELMRKSFLQEIRINDTCLSKRELECLRHTLRGHSAKQTANMLGISHRTVEEHLSNIKIKMGVASKAKLIEKVIDHF